MAQQLLKDPYNFDFMTLTEEAQERDLEQGLLLCKSRNRFVAEYAIHDIAKPLGVAEFHYYLEQLPEQLKGTLPTIEEIEAELEKPPTPSSGPAEPDK